MVIAARCTDVLTLRDASLLLGIPRTVARHAVRHDGPSPIGKCGPANLYDRRELLDAISRGQRQNAGAHKDVAETAASLAAAKGPVVPVVTIRYDGTSAVVARRDLNNLLGRAIET